MPIILGSTNISNIYKGSTVIEKVYKGSTLVYQKGILPSGYKQCKYLESTGTQVIKTNIIPTTTIEVSIDYFMMLSGNQRYGEFIASRTADNSVDSFAFRELRTDASVNLQRASGGINNVLSCSFGTAYEVYMSQSIFKVGNNQRTSETSQNGTYPLYLFAGNLANSVWRNSKCRMGVILMVDNGVTLGNFIPCLDRNDVPCMYEAVSKTTLYNQGTGQFNYEVV